MPSPDGPAGVLAGDADAVRGFVDDLREDPRFAALTTKESWSRRAAVPAGCSSRSSARSSGWTTRRSDPTPAARRPSLPRRCGAGSTRAATTRVARSCCSTRATPSRSTTAPFTGALDWRIERFTQFPDAVAAHRADLEGKTVVSFCTGGIRCEKAAIYLREEGIDAFQLDGGILGYFEQVGGDHFTGECFVFDEREALAPDLSAVGSNCDGRLDPWPR